MKIYRNTYIIYLHVHSPRGVVTEVIVLEPLAVDPKEVADSLLAALDADVMGGFSDKKSSPAKKNAPKSAVKSVPKAFRISYMQSVIQTLESLSLADTGKKYKTKAYLFTQGGVHLSVIRVKKVCM